MRHKRIIDYLSQQPLHQDAAHFVNKYLDSANNRMH